MKPLSFVLLAFIAFTPLAIGSSVYASPPLSSVTRSMVQTVSVFPGGEKSMRCTGFVVDAAKGLALTAEHCVVKDAEAFLVDGEPSEVVKKSQWLTLFKVKPMGKPPLNIAKERSKIGDLTWGFGWAFGDVFLQLQRMVAGYDKTDLVLDNAYIQGMSGGPVVNEKLEVVGLIQGGVPGGAWTSGIDEIRAFLKD